MGKKGWPGLAAALFGKREQKPAAKPGREKEPAGPKEILRFWEEEDPPYQITLTDVRSVERSWRRTMGTSLRIGFSQEMDLCIHYDKSVSRRHCEILREGDLFYIINHSQSNGTYLNRRAVTEKTPIADGDIITMGRVEMRLEIDG